MSVKLVVIVIIFFKLF